jgi:hypothetical protein
LVTQGDVPEGRVWVVSECWNSQLGSVFRVALDCPTDTFSGDKCTIVRATGMLSACDRTLRTEELPPANPGMVMEDPESPEMDLLPPSAMPSGEAE